MKSVHELWYLGRDFVRYALGRDYFRQRTQVGLAFRDPRCYFNDLRGKTRWEGNRIRGLPAYRFADSAGYVMLPVMVLHYGLGAIDCYFAEGDGRYLGDVRRVAEWLLENVLPQGYFDNGVTDHDPAHAYYSRNSSMVQGEVLSFCSRVVRYGLVDAVTIDALRGLMDDVFANMILPLDQGGTAWTDGEDLYFCEFCRKDHCVVLNGWIYSYFGIRDYAHCSQDARAPGIADATVRSMRRELAWFQRADGWTYYDNKGRICSPFYHDLHIVLVDAMSRLTGAREFAENMDRAKAANRPVNRMRYTAYKILEKLRDKQAYGSQA